MADTVRILKNAKELLRQSGLARGTWLNSDTGCMCAEGAVFAAAAGEPVNSPWGMLTFARDAAYEAIDVLDEWAETNTAASSIADYNDNYAESVEDVLSAFDKAIEQADMKEGN